MEGQRKSAQTSFIKVFSNPQLGKKKEMSLEAYIPWTQFLLQSTLRFLFYFILFLQVRPETKYHFVKGEKTLSRVIKSCKQNRVSPINCPFYKHFVLSCEKDNFTGPSMVPIFIKCSETKNSLMAHLMLTLASFLLSFVSSVNSQSILTWKILH